MKKSRVLLLLLTGCTVFGTVKNTVGVPSIVEVAPGIYAGNRSDAANEAELKKFGITVVLNVAAEVNDKPIPGIIMMKVPIKEENTPEMHKLVDEAGAAIAISQAMGHKVLVHCWLGENRTPWVIAHFLAKCHGGSWQSWFARIKKVRPECYIKDWMF